MMSQTVHNTVITKLNTMKMTKQMVPRSTRIFRSRKAAKKANAPGMPLCRLKSITCNYTILTDATQYNKLPLHNAA